MLSLLYASDFTRRDQNEMTLNVYGALALPQRESEDLTWV